MVVFWTALTAFMSRGCQRFPLLSALWLVGDSVAVSLRRVWTRLQMMSVLRIFQVVLLLSHLAYPVFSWLHVHSWTSANLKPWTPQDVITPCSSHSCLTDPNSVVLWKNIGSGAHSSFSASTGPSRKNTHKLKPTAARSTWQCSTSTTGPSVVPIKPHTLSSKG